MTESNRIEFKEKLTDKLDLEEEVIAFLNYREGGISYIGVNKEGVPVGVEDIDGDMLKIKDRIRNKISPSPMGLFDVTAEYKEGVKVIRVFVASGTEKPYYLSKVGMSPKGCFIRVGTAAEQMTQDMIEYLFAHRVRNSLRNIKSPRQDLTFKIMSIYYQSKGIDFGDGFAKTLGLLTEEGQFNYVAFLLADENDTSMKLAKYAGTDRDELISNNEYGYCCVLKAADLVMDKLKVENAVTTRKTYPYRIDTPLWHEKSIRELVLNAIIHNDYFNEVPPKFEIFSDRLEIISAGRLPDGLSEEEFFAGVSVPRNKELMRVFRDVDMGEALGSGMRLVMKHYPKSCFVFMPNFLKIVIPFHTTDEAKGGMKIGTEGGMKTDDKSLRNNEKQIDSSGMKSGMKKGLRKEEGSPSLVRLRILEIIEKEPNISITELALRLSKARSSIQKHMAFLKDKHIITRIGSDKGGHWKVIENNQ